MAQQAPSTQVMSKPLPQILDGMVAAQEAAEQAKLAAIQAAVEAANAAKDAVAQAISDLMDGTITPITDDLSALKKLINDNFSKAQLALDANAKAAKNAYDAAIAAAKSAQEARDAYNAVQASQNDLLEKYGDLNGTVASNSEDITKLKQAVADIMVANVNTHAQSSKAYLNAYKKHGITEKTATTSAAPVPAIPV